MSRPARRTTDRSRLPRTAVWMDLLVVIGLGGLLFSLVGFGREWTGVQRPAIAIDLSPWALPRYTVFSLTRGLLAYTLSLGFTLVYGYWAAKDRAAAKILVPLLDVLQSIPVLGFMPGLVLAMVALFPHSNIGLELAAVVMIFTGQAWNMTFSFYHSLRSVPADLREVAVTYRFSWWERLRQVEIPFATMGLVWNSMMSMAGGWFFLMINEAFQLGDHDYRLPGIGSYMSVAVEKGRVDAMIWAVLAMTLMILTVDQLLWRPVVAWAQKFRVEESGGSEEVSSWFLDWLRGSDLLRQLARLRRGVMRALGEARASRRVVVPVAPPARPGPSRTWAWISPILLGGVLLALGYGALRLAHLLRDVPLDAWPDLLEAGGWTLGRVLLSTAIGTLWALPAGLAIGLNPRLSRLLQPVVQVVASFPAPMLFPLVISALAWAGISLGWGSIVLMLLGTQWYILFNVIAGAMVIPSDLREATRSYRITGWRRFRALYLPAVFPYLVTGWVTAAGGAWNASIVAEFVSYHGEVLTTHGLGATISAAAAQADFPKLAAGILVMSATVVLFNRLVWRRCYRLAEERFSLSK